MMKYDCIVIGGGVTGCLALRALSAYGLRLLLLEAGGDLASGASRANSGIIHAGFDPEPGTLKARLNARGAELYRGLAAPLDIPYRPLPSLVAAYTEEDCGTLEALLERGRENGIGGLSLLSREKAIEAEPNISKRVCGALLAETSAIVEPWTVAIAAAECAADNGAEVRACMPVSAIKKTASGFYVTAGGETFEADAVVAAAGVHADDVHALLAPPKFKINARRGDYFVLDRRADGLVKNILFPCPTKKGKGILITPEIHGRIMLGPDSEPTEDKGGHGTSLEGLEAVLRAAQSVLDVKLPMNLQIRTFAGMRPTSDTGDFIVEQCPEAPGFFEAAGIESPGLASAPATAELLCRLVTDYLGAAKREGFVPSRRPRLTSSDALKRKLPGAGNLICRCEHVTEAQIIDAVHRNCGAKTVKGVKLRTSAGAGGCQGGFCQPNVVDILARELAIDKTAVRYDGVGSEILVGRK